MQIKKALSKANKKIDDSDALISIKRGLIQAVAGGVLFFALRYGVMIDEVVAFSIASAVVCGVYKYIRRKKYKK